MKAKSEVEGIVFYLSNCDTCAKILKLLGGAPEFIRQDIKSNPISPEQWKELHSLAGSYDALFSRRAVLYKELNLKDKTLNEEDIKQYLFQEYTFLKRPVFVIDNKIWIGNTKPVIESLHDYLQKRRKA